MLLAPATLVPVVDALERKGFVNAAPIPGTAGASRLC